MFREHKSSSSDNMVADSAKEGTSPSGHKKSHHSQSNSRDLTPETTPCNSVHLMDTGELSPLKQFQRMKENGTIRLMPKGRRGTDGNQSDPCDVSASDKEYRRYLRMSMTMNPLVLPVSRRNSSISVTGAADLNGVGPSLLKMSSEANVHLSQTSLQPSDSASNVSTCTDMSISSNASSSISKPSHSSSVSSHTLHSTSRAPSTEPKDILLEHLLGGDPVYGTRPITPIITQAGEHPASRRKPPMARSSATLPMEKPTIEVKLVRNEQPRSSYRKSKSVEELDKPDDGEATLKPGMFLRHAGSNFRNSFIDRHRDSICNSANDVQTVLKIDSQELREEEIYSLPQPQSYSEDTLKAVKKITDKYDTLQMRKLRALSFREGTKSVSSDGSTPVSPLAENQPHFPAVEGEPTTDKVVVELSYQSRDQTPDQSCDSTPNQSPERLPISLPQQQLQQQLQQTFLEPSRWNKASRPPRPPPTARKCQPVDMALPHILVSKPESEDPACEDPAFPCDGPSRAEEKKEEERVPEVHDLLPNTDGEEVVCVTSGITQKDISRIDLFYRSRESEVMVCQCLADLVTGAANPATGVVETWSAVSHTGVPVLVMNSGLGKRRRELFIVLAERETGFPLWQDRVNYLTNYKDINTTVHQLQPSNNLRIRVGLRFYCINAAGEFLNKYCELTKDPQDDLWKVSNSRMDKNRRTILKKLRMKKRPSKCDISQPCNFAHVTKVDTKDYVHYESIQDMLPSSPLNSAPASAASAKGAIFRPRLQTT